MLRLFYSLQTLLRRAVWPVIVMNHKYLWHYVSQPAVMGSPPLLKFCIQLVCDDVEEEEEGQKMLSSYPFSSPRQSPVTKA